MRECGAKQQLKVFFLVLSLATCFLIGFKWTQLQVVIPLIRKTEEQPAKTTITTQAPLHYVQEDSMPEDHPEMKFMRKFGRTHGLPTQKEMQNMTQKELAYIYHSYLDNIDFICRRKIRLGKTGDGGWEVCDDYEFRPMQPCVVYSFGINNDFSFDDEMGAIYKCKVFAFDPSMKQKSYDRSAYVRFLKIGLSGKGGSLPRNIPTSGWEVKTLTGLKAMLGHQNTTIDIIKMDIEYSEWPSLVDILENQELNHVRQFLIEFHTNPGDSADTFRQRLQIFNQLEAVGFRRFHTHKNPWGIRLNGEYPVARVSAMEVYFLNTNFRRLKKETPA